MEAVLFKSKSLLGFIVANVLTCIRIFCCIFIWHLARRHGYIDPTMLVIGLLGGLTDILDGVAARILNGQSKFGALFDKGADKFFILTIAFSFYYYCSPLGDDILNSTIGYFLIILAGMELFLAIFGGLFALLKNSRLESNRWGKAKMWTEGVMLITWGFYLLIDSSGNLFLENELTINVLLLLAISLAAKSGYDYCFSLFEK